MESLSNESLAALQEFLRESNPNMGDSNSMHDLTSMLASRRIIESSSESESDQDDACGDEENDTNEKVNHVEYYKALFPERYTDNVEPRVQNPIAVVTMDDIYVQNLVVKALSQKHEWTVVEKVPDEGQEYHFHWGEYETIDWFSKQFSAGRVMVSCYYNRKGLIRKGHLAQILEKWHTKHPEMPHRFLPKSYILELQHKENDDESEEMFSSYFEAAFTKSRFPGFATSGNTPDTRHSIIQNDDVWIIKPSVTNQANGIALCRTKDQLRDVIRDADELQRAGDFVLQKYIDPLLVNGLKFHLRVFLVLVGNLVAYVDPDFLAISSLEPYDGASLDETRAHLTNIAHQQVLSKEDEYRCMRRFQEYEQDLVDSQLVSNIEQAKEKIEATRQRVFDIIRDTVIAVSSELTFQSRSNCFEIFGLDFLIDPEWNVWILEANAEPDLGKAGDRLQYVIDDMLKDVISLVIDNNPSFSDESKHKLPTKLVKVYDRQSSNNNM